MSQDNGNRHVASLPVTWVDGVTGEQVGPTTHAPVITPADEAELEVALAQKVCGTCKYFAHAHGQELMRAQKFVERLVREERWKVHHLASPLNQLGTCGAHDSGAGGESMITGALHKACDQYREDQGTISISKKGVF